MNTSDNPEHDKLSPSSGEQAPSNGVESREKEPLLTLTVAGPCKTPDGNYVGLSKVQRNALGVEVGDSVLLTDSNGKALGLYTVGTGSKELLKVDGKFTANGLDENVTVEVRRAPGEHPAMKLDFVHGVESDAKHGRRSEKIAERFEGFDGSKYIVLPTAIAKRLILDNKGVGSQKSTVASISLGRVRLNSTEYVMPIVPAGSTFGMTSALEAELNLTEIDASSVEYLVDEEGVLVVDMQIATTE